MRATALPTKIMTAEEVYHDLLRRIIHLELKPASMISENAMCSQYGVSRSVIRTVFARLEQISFVEIYPQRGTFVKPLDLEYISNVLLLRTAVEKEVIYQVFTRLSEDFRLVLVAKMDENLKKQELLRGEKDYTEAFQNLDNEFHHIMIDSVGMDKMAEMISVPLKHLARWKNFDVRVGERIPSLIDQHRAITDAIRQGNLAETQSLMAEHLDTVSAIAQRAREGFPEYFREEL